MRKSSEPPSLSQMIALSQPPAPRRRRETVSRPTTVQISLALGVMATAVSLGVLAGPVARAIAGG